MILSCKAQLEVNLIFIRNIYIHSALECSHYKVLGLSSTATQSEIKSAFYELSKKHHPDKNRGCEKSAKKFRDVVAAYEVLRNEKLRQIYDRDLMVQTRSRSTTANSANFRADYNDDAERSFYERSSKRKNRYYYGKTKHYDFDAWYRAHYGSSSFSKTHSNQFQFKHRTAEYDVPSSKFFKFPRLYFVLGGILILVFFNPLRHKKS